MKRAILLLLLLTFSTAHGGAPTKAAPKADHPVDYDMLLKAINFALTGSDAGGYVFADQKECRVIRHSGEGQEYETIEIFNLNNVQADRINVTWGQLKYTDHTDDVIDVALHGDRVIYDMSMPKGKTSAQEADHQYRIISPEHDRMLRAWRYIYAHGCMSAKNSF